MTTTTVKCKYLCAPNSPCRRTSWIHLKQPYPAGCRQCVIGEIFSSAHLGLLWRPDRYIETCATKSKNRQWVIAQLRHEMTTFMCIDAAWLVKLDILWYLTIHANLRNLATTLYLFCAEESWYFFHERLLYLIQIVCFEHKNIFLR